MRVTIIYFSQTGNTLKGARAIADIFFQEGHQARLIALQDASVEDAIYSDLFVVGAPCFSSRAPQPVLKFLDSLPKMDTHKAIVFATSGGAPGKVLYDLANALQKKGVEVLAGHLIRGEVRHPAPSLFGRFLDRPNVEDLDQVDRFARSVSASFSNKMTPIPKKYVTSIKYKGGLYEFLGSAISDNYVRLFLPEPKVNDIQCDQCECCSQECPMHNIIMAPYPVLGNECIRCYHCYNICPSDSFTLNWKLGNPILRILYNQAFERWFGDVKPGERIY